jgi:hypothetical protein
MNKIKTLKLIIVAIISFALTIFTSCVPTPGGTTVSQQLLGKWHLESVSFFNQDSVFQNESISPEYGFEESIGCGQLFGTYPNYYYSDSVAINKYDWTEFSNGGIYSENHKTVVLGTIPVACAEQIPSTEIIDKVTGNWSYNTTTNKLIITTQTTDTTYTNENLIQSISGTSLKIVSPNLYGYAIRTYRKI